MSKNNQDTMQSNASKVVYLNYAATSFPKNPDVVNVYNEALALLPGGNRQGIGKGGLVDEAREMLATGLNVGKENIYFSSGSTQALNEIILGSVNSGDHCLFDNRSHNSVVRPMHELPSSIDAEMCPLYREDETLDLDALTSRLNTTTKLVCLVHDSNVTGTVYDIKTVISAVREKAPQSVVLVDAAQSAGAIDLKDALKADYVVFQGHKHLHAPHGAAVVVAKRHVRPVIFGGGQTLTGQEGDPHLLEVGTQNHAAIYATAVAFGIASDNLLKHQTHERALYTKLRSALDGVYGLEPLPVNPKFDHVSIMAFRTKMGTPEGDWVPFLQSKNIIARGGLHCSPCLHEQLGLTQYGTLRLSLGWYTTDKDVEAAAHAINEFSDHLKTHGPAHPVQTSCSVSFPSNRK